MFEHAVVASRVRATPVPRLFAAGLLFVAAACTDDIATPRTAASTARAPLFNYVGHDPVEVAGTLRDIAPSGIYIIGFNAGWYMANLKTSATVGLPGTNVDAWAVNSSGVVVGSINNGAGVQPAYWRGADGPHLLPLPIGQTGGVVRDVSAGPNMTMVGWTTDGTKHSPTVWSIFGDEASGLLVNSPPDGGELLALSQPGGSAVGFVNAFGNQHAAVWNLFAGGDPAVGDPGGALGINQTGHAIGLSINTGYTGFQLATGGSDTPLYWTMPFPYIGTLAYAINDGGMIVGAALSEEGGSIKLRPAVWKPGTGSYILDLAKVGGVYGQLIAIANDGTAIGIITDGLNPEKGVIVNVARDIDNDGIADVADNCPRRWNEDQTDSNTNDIGDVCDPASPPVITNITSNYDERRVGEPFRFTVTGYDPGGRALTYTWSFTDGSTLSGRAVSKSFATEDGFIASVTANNGAGGVSAAKTLIVFVEDYPPTAPTVTLDLPIVVAQSGREATFDLAIDDVNGGTVDYTIFWGDGTANATGNCATPCDLGVSHTYTTLADVRIARVTATDAGGLSRKATESFAVASVGMDTQISRSSGLCTVHPIDQTLVLTILGTPDVGEAIDQSSVRLLGTGNTPIRPTSIGPEHNENGDEWPDRHYYFRRATLINAGGMVDGADQNWISKARTLLGGYRVGLAVVTVPGC